MEPGRRLSHYTIEAPIGRGGMGEVFRARDDALGRTVAIKVLPAAFDPDLKRRLLREAEASRRLQHPGIATFFEAGEDDGVAFIAMELVRGTTLRRRLAAGPLPLADALALATGLLEALGHAHAAGIVHRDLKPENVMLDETGAARLLDFGLALHTVDGDDPTMVAIPAFHAAVTAPGELVGSAGYMAPEQLRGEPGGPRADLFAVGAVVHEALTGRPAFAGTSPAARMAATLFAEIAPLPAEARALDGVLARALARNPEERYASAAAFLRDLRAVGEGRAVAAYPDSVAVLDFANRTGDHEVAWVGSGIAESLGADLGRHGAVRVLPRARVLAAVAASAAADGPAGTPPAAIGARLGCRWVVAGGYQRMGDALRVVLELVHVPTESTVATEKLDGTLGGIFALQDALSASAAKALDLRDTAPADGASRGAGGAAAPALDAYACCTRGRQHWIRMSKGEFDRAEEMFEEAVRQEPAYADALAGLAAVHDMRFTFTTDPSELARAVELAERAIDADPRHAAARVWLAYARWRQGRLDDALAAIGEAAALDPADHYPLYFEACMRLHRREPERALPLYQEAVARAPGFGFAWFGLAWTHVVLGHAVEAHWSFGRAIALESQGFHATAGVAGYLGESLRREGRLDEARAQCMAGLDAVERSDHMYRDTLRAACLVTLGRVALDRDDAEAARAAFRQATLHLEGRPRTLGGGFLACQAEAGRAAADRDPEALRAAEARFAARAPGDWSWFWLCTEEDTLPDLERARETTMG